MLTCISADPTFRPQNVSAWPLSDGSMHIQWTFNASKHLKSLERAKLRLSNITLNITEASTGSLVMTDYVPINYQRCVLVSSRTAIYTLLISNMPYIQGMFWGVGLAGMGTVTTRDLNSVLFRCESALHQDELSSLGLLVSIMMMLV